MVFGLVITDVVRRESEWSSRLRRFIQFGRLSARCSCPSGRKPCGRRRALWRDCISWLTWERLAVPPGELEEVAHRGRSGLLWLGCCSPEPEKDKKMDGW